MDPPLQLQLVTSLLFAGNPPPPGVPAPEPREGMEFDSYEEAFAFYAAYGRREGFRASTKSSRRSKKDNDYVEAKLVCSRAGEKVEKPQALYRRRSLKTGCRAAMHVRRREGDGKWFVYRFVREHNHELVRERDPCPFWSPVGDAAALPAGGCGARASCAIADGAKGSRVLAERGKKKGRGVNDESSVEEGLGNGVGTGRRLFIEVGDLQLLLNFCAHMQNVNPGFFYTLDLDDQQHVKSVFWVDSKGIHDYISFGDAVSFDTMCITGKRKLLFAAVSGVNHHGQRLLFGFALLSDETTSTFVWLMELWLKTMHGRAPELVITDQDEALKLAIKHVLPNSRLRYCMWNIKRKIPEKLGHVTRQCKDFIEEFNRCVHKSCTDKEFETRWDEMIVKFELQENEWLQTLFEDREYWVPIYLKDTFSMGMSSSHRSESMNFLFDKHVSRKSMIKELVKRYVDFLNDHCQKEAKADFDTWCTKPSLKSPSPYELQASIVYTRYAFEKFQGEVMGTRACHVFRKTEDGQNVSFCVKDLEQDEEFMVTWNGAESKISCLCRSFEFNGYLCRHAMIALQFSGVPKLPSPYLLKRWTKDAKSWLTLSQKPNTVTSRLQRFNYLCQHFTRVANEASLSQENYDSMMLALGKVISAIDSQMDGANSTCFNN